MREKVVAFEKVAAFLFTEIHGIGIDGWKNSRYTKREMYKEETKGV